MNKYYYWIFTEMWYTREVLPLKPSKMFFAFVIEAVHAPKQCLFKNFFAKSLNYLRVIQRRTEKKKKITKQLKCKIILLKRGAIQMNLNEEVFFLP